MTPSLYHQANDSGKLQDVQMNHIGYLQFSPSKTSLGTSGLDGCSYVVILSSKVAILGHFVPKPHDTFPTPPNSTSGEAFLLHKMNDVRNLFNQHKNNFKKDDNTKGLVAFAVLGTEDFSEHLRELIVTHLKEWQIPYSSIAYSMLPGNNDRPSGQGSVLVQPSDTGVANGVYDFRGKFAGIGC